MPAFIPPSPDSLVEEPAASQGFTPPPPESLVDERPLRFVPPPPDALVEEPKPESQVEFHVPTEYGPNAPQFEVPMAAGRNALPEVVAAPTTPKPVPQYTDEQLAQYGTIGPSQRGTLRRLADAVLAKSE